MPAPSTAPAPRLPGGPDPEQPIPRTPVHGLDLEGYARVAAVLAEGREPRRTVLAGAGLDDARWIDVEKTWLLRVAAAALRADHELLSAYEQATAAAQEAALADAPVPSLEQMADLVGGIEAGRDPAEVLAAAKLTAAAFARAERIWTARFAADAGMLASFRGLVEARRRG